MDVSGLAGGSVGSPGGVPILPAAERFPVENLDELFNVATVLALCNAKPDLLLVALQSMGNDLRESLRQAGESSRAILRPHLTALQESIKARLALRIELEKDRERRRELTSKKTQLDETIRRLVAEIARARLDEEEKRFKAEEDRLHEEHKAAVKALVDVVAEEERARRDRAAEAAVGKAAQLERLKQRAARATEYVNDTAQRVAALAGSLITYRVARFLSWLGFASVAGTGTIWTLFVRKDAEKELSSLLELVRRFTQSLATTPLGQYSAATMVLAASVFGAVAVFLGVDWLLEWRFSGKWGSEQPEDDRFMVKIAPTAINRRSYLQLVAAAPIVFAVGLLAALFGASANGTSDLPNFLPALTQAFVGSAVALVATAAFMMYAIKFLEPRLRKVSDQTSRPAWEFAVAPIALIIAIVVSSFAPVEQRLAWAGWTLFMMCSSLALAYGLVYRGIYNDANEARRNLHWIEKEIEKSYMPEERKSEAERALTALVERYNQDRASLMRRRRWQRINSMNNTAPQSGTATSRAKHIVARAKQFVLRILRRADAGAEPPDVDWLEPPPLTALELEVASTEVIELAAARIERTKVQSELQDLLTVIAEKEAESRWNTIEGLRNQQANLEGAIAASEARDRSQQALAAKAETELLERVRAIIAAAGFVSGPFDEFVAVALGSTSKPAAGPGPMIHP